MHPFIPICMVFVGCCSNVVFLELIVREDLGCGNIITFAQFAFIAVEGFIFTSNFGRNKSKIPMSMYIGMVSMFFVVQVVNNFAFVFDIPMTLHMIFRAGSLIANLVLGIVILKKRYPSSKYIAVILITCGIILATYASKQSHEEAKAEENNEEISAYESMRMSIGVLVLTAGLFMTARMGIFQETLYLKYGKHPSEALFYNHALPLPGFLLLSSDIYTHATLFSASAPLALPVVNYAVPRLWVFLLGNVLTQYMCIKSVFILTTECTSLTVTLVVTLRKFMSLMFSIMYFQNPFTQLHWIGTAFVFGGTLIFTDVYGLLFHSSTKEVKEKKQS